MSRTGTYLLRFLPRAFFCVWATWCISSVQAQYTVVDSIKSEIAQLKKSRDFSERDTTYIDLVNAWGKELRYFRTDSLYLLSNLALENSKTIGYKNGESRALLQIGDYFSDKGESENAEQYYQEALKIALETNNCRLILRIRNNLATEYTYLGNYAKAMTGYLGAIDLAEEKKDTLMLSILNENIAGLYADQKDYNQALDFYKIVKKHNNTLGNELDIAMSGSNLASIYADMGELDYAMFHINKSISVFEKKRVLDWLAFAYEIKGKTYLKHQDYKWALYWYNQSESLHETVEDARSSIDLYNGMAEAHLGSGNDSISEALALKAYTISKQLKLKKGIQKCAKTLYRINKNKEQYGLALEYHELFQTVSDTLSRNENKKSLTMLKTQLEHERQRELLIAENERSLARQKNYIIAILLVLILATLSIFLKRRDERIQRKLNIALKARAEILEKSQRELREINETKTKLFSIVGHDLRGPIGALQGLLQMFKDGELKKEEFLGFIPKLKTDVDHILFTLNNLLSWGHTQMNGSVTKPAVVCMHTLVAESVNLLSELAKSKLIGLVNNVADNVLTWSDANQVDIVMRNLISNALKFTPEHGIVSINAKESEKHWEISVKDTGVGMDKITLQKLFSDSESVSTYGTNNEKGTGLGLSLCKEMVEKNNGAIRVESTLGKGTTFYFTLPKAEKIYKKTA